MHSAQLENFMFLFDPSKKDFDTNVDESVSTYEEGQTSTSRELQCYKSKLESDSCSEDTNGCITDPSQSESDDETRYQ